MPLRCIELPHSFIEVTGQDRTDFLQGLITQDMRRLSADAPLLYGALLTPQGKYLYDFFLWHEADRILIEVDAARRDELMGVLRRYKLRKDVALAPLDAPVWQVFGDEAHDGLADPRLPQLGWKTRARPDLPEAPMEDWDALRRSLTVPEAARDLRIGLSTPFEGNIDLHNGIAFDKGCYMGQELVSRIHHRGLVKRRYPDL